MDDRSGERPGLDQFDRIEADGQQQIGALEKIPNEFVARHIELARIVGVVLGHHALGHRRHDHRCAYGLGQMDERRARAAPHRRDACENHRPACGLEQFDRIGFGSADRKHLRCAQHAHGRQLDFVVARLGADHIRRGGEMHRPGALGACDAQRLAHDGADGVRLHRDRPFADRREQTVVIDHLMGKIGLALALDLARDRQHRNPVEIGIRHGIDEVGRARAERGQADAGTPGELAVGFGHQAGGALARAEDEAHAFTARRLQEFDRGIPRVAEDVADAGGGKILDDDLRGVHAGFFGRQR